MTSSEVLAFVRSMLDDGIDHLLYWHNDTATTRLRITDFIWEAQLIVIKEKLVQDDSRAIRPLLVETNVRHVSNRNTTPEQRRLEFRRFVSPNSFYITKMMAVKAVRLMRDNAPIETGIVATYMPTATYDNMHGAFNNMPRYRPSIKDPYAAYYTIVPDTNVNGRVPDTHCLHYTEDIFGTSANVMWVRYPVPFTQQTTLELPPEYHYAVCLKAAELMNTLDVGETTRGRMASANLGQRMTIEESV